MNKSPVAVFSAIVLLFSLSAYAAGQGDDRRLEGFVTELIRPLMDKYDIPGMAVAITVDGRRSTFHFGVASRETGRAVDERTIFEIGSVSKTFTATLGSYAEASGALSLSDPAGRHMPELAGTSIGQARLLDLGTYAAGGLPLQFPDDVTDEDDMVGYFRTWQPAFAPGTQRLYSNPSIGLFGYLVARSLGRPYDEIMEKDLFPRLGLTSTYITVPQERLDDYAFGYSKSDKPVRVTPGVLDSEAYGVKTTAADMIRFVEANMAARDMDPRLQQAITATRTGYYTVGAMVQGLGWEMYPDPADLPSLLEGNGSEVVLKPNAAIRLEPPLPPRPDVLVNKTGSTNGFGAYVAFVPARRVGVVILANRNYPIPERVRTAHRILGALESSSSAAP